MTPRGERHVRWTGPAAAALALLAPLIVAAGGCADAPPSSAPAEGAAPPPTAGPMTVVGALRATVDLTAGTMTFEPMPASGAAAATSAGGRSGRGAVVAPRPAIYGDQNVTVRLSNSAVAVTTDATTGRRRY
ncbi:MAG TPA: hypothetical protein VKA84_02420, partial [Gemmatimonadaceae bacterium]|nr:hypothetical protein [Gemmatimonadaceae bacterium]